MSPELFLLVDSSALTLSIIVWSKYIIIIVSTPVSFVIMDKLESLQAEVESDPSEANFEALLTTYPLLFGYWIKYLEKFPGEILWKRALDQCPSIELWTAFLDREMASLEDCKLAADSVGLFFQSHPIWDRYLAKLQGVERAKVLSYLITLPLYEYSKYSQLAIESQNEYPGEFGDIAEILKQTSQLVNDKWAFESQLSRHYFHVIDLEESEKKVWDEYLDYQESLGNHAQTAALYERCLVPCALYKGFWMRYIRWLSAAMPDKVDSAFERGQLYLDPTELEQWAIERARYRQGLGFPGAQEILAPFTSRTVQEVQRQLADQAAGSVSTVKRQSLQSLRDNGDLVAFFNADIAQNGCAEARALVKAEPLV